MNNAGAAESRTYTRTQMGIGPLITQAKLFFGLQFSGGNISLRLRPLVVLANPYNVPLTGTWWVKLNPGNLKLLYPKTDDDGNEVTVDPDNPDKETFDTTGTDGKINEVTLFNTSTNAYRAPSTRMWLKISGVTLEPGRAYVFTMDHNQADSGGYKDPKPILEMVNDFDESTAFTLPTGETLWTDRSYVTLYSKAANLKATLYAGATSPSTLSDADARDAIIHDVYSKEATKAINGVDPDYFLVYPTPTDGTGRDGGGVWATIEDPFFDLQRPMQAPLLQLNYRARFIMTTGVTSGSHPLQWAFSYVAGGSNASVNGAFKYDVLFTPESTSKVHWGLANNGKLSARTTHPAGADNQDGQSILYEIPQAATPLNSLGQLQHFNTVGFLEPGDQNTKPDPVAIATAANQFQNNYLISNSYPNVRVDRNKPVGGYRDIGGHYDGSWLFNEVLWDRFFISSYPASGDFDFSTDRLVNNRYQPFRPEIAPNATDSFRSTSTSAASNLLTAGAFNVNSTSPEAWKALLTYAQGIAMNTASPDATVNVPFSRFSYPIGGSTDSRNGISEDAWKGFHNLSEDEIERLADEIVLQVRRRGPFTSLADFVNRRLIEKTDDPLDTGLSGALQSALDAVVNLSSNITLSGLQVDYEDDIAAEEDFLPETRVAGFPGYVLQADLLTPLAPVLSARSDTFVIRAYGNAVNPINDDVVAHAWCEAVVQRLPDYVDPANAADASSSDLTPTNATFGRRFHIISFRWLSADEV
jgi:hypothetical protein